MEKLLTIQQLSELLQISRRTLYDWTHTGYIPHYKLPKGVRFSEKVVINWLNKKRIRGRGTYKIQV